MRHALAELGIDPALVDPLRVLASIAANRSMPPTAKGCGLQGAFGGAGSGSSRGFRSCRRRGFGAGAGTAGGAPKGELKP